MNKTLAKDKIGGCRYIITVSGNLLTCTMLGYGLKAVETQEVSRKRNGHFSYDAVALRDKMVTLERRMHDLARLTTVLQANKISGVAALSEQRTTPGKKVKSKNPLDKIKV